MSKANFSKSPKINPYSLYQTFNCNLQTTDLPFDQKEKLKEYVDLLYDDQKTAFVRLIIEHARLSGDNILPDSPPYKGELSESDGSINFNIENFPINLKWILWKFFEMCNII
jgi:hypothetical protein